ncbi:aspartate carbamoyltransferase [Kangiella sp. HZ709]|uniref:aspartate carbamoyltransferase n=1 Tax=Kangiella sp. HZ709 TaxID=2666328 RepID=UPI0012B15522|nr:aspartate carbamoyltransferase [Kangiella sp. HZ709]MRX27662.1 aspartate carbamoyltransferase [Kangiella sp. HZ709]
MDFQGQHILSIEQFDREAVETVLSIAAQMTPYVERKKRCSVLDGTILASLFFEPSTRTRVSFSSAFNLLGGKVMETVGMGSSSLTKGESLFDTAQVISGYADVIAMRHPEAFSVSEFAKGATVPVINGGDGPNEHPTQALLDTYTIFDELLRIGKPMETLRIALVGDLKNGRTVHSLSRVLSLFPNVEFTFVAPNALTMPEKIMAVCEDAGHRVSITQDLSTGLANQDVVYMTRVQEERFDTQEEANLYRGKYRLTQNIYDNYCADNTIIMHPLPRDSRPDANELSEDMNRNPNLAIFRQSNNGIKIRMALFALTLGVEQQLKNHESEVTWFTRK